MANGPGNEQEVFGIQAEIAPKVHFLRFEFGTLVGLSRRPLIHSKLPHTLKFRSN